MKRLIIAALVLGAALPAAPANAATGPAIAAGSAKASLRGFQCQISRDPAGRGIMITAVMKPLAHTKRMGVRFELLYRKKGGGQGSVGGYGHLGKWIYPTDPKTLGQRPGDVFIVNAPVQVLSVAPAYYRFKVNFRWTGVHGKVLGTATRYSPVCFQPELRPDLAVGAINVQPSTRHPSLDRYTATIRNGGLSSAGPFEAQLTDGTVTKSHAVQQLGPHRKIIVSFVGPQCDPSAPPTLTADPLGAVDDFNRANNTAVAICPA